MVRGAPAFGMTSHFSWYYQNPVDKEIELSYCPMTVGRYDIPDQLQVRQADLHAVGRSDQGRSGFRSVADRRGAAVDPSAGGGIARQPQHHSESLFRAGEPWRSRDAAWTRMFPQGKSRGVAQGRPTQAAGGRD